jgi:hypothetical protein
LTKGFIKDENEPMLTFFPEINSRNQLLDLITIKDLITIGSGFYCGVKDGEKALSDMRKSKDWVKFIFDLRMTTRVSGKTVAYVMNGVVLVSSSAFVNAFCIRCCMVRIGLLKKTILHQ